MSGGAIIGFDIGTTSVKAGLFGEDGTLLASHAAKYPTRHGPGGRVEQDPADWLRHMDRALAAFSQEISPEQVCAIGLTSQVNTHLFVDADVSPLAPAIIWQDTRCAEDAAQLDAAIDPADKTRWWGAPLPVDASHCMARMRWMARNRPGQWERCAHVILPKDYCLHHLTGELATDAISNVGMVDLKGSFIPELLALVPGADQKMLPLGRMDAAMGTVRSGLPFAGTPVAVGTMDAWAGMFGVGVSRPDQGFYLSGTSEILGIISPRVVPTPGVLVFPPVNAIQLHAAPTQSGGASIAWFCDLFALTPEQMNELAASVLPSETPVPLFLPHMSGERAPLWDPDCRGTIIGMGSDTSKAQLARAVFEGVAFSARWLFDTLATSADIRPERLHCGGGGFGSDSFNRLRADILGVELHKVSVRDPGVLGAAALAAVAAGRFDNVSEAVGQIVGFEKVYEPDSARVPSQDEKFRLFQKAYQAARPLNHALVRP